jgi:hypothetical protein
MLIHGTDDALVPIEDAHRLRAAGRPGTVRLLEVPGGHDPRKAFRAHLFQVIDFLREVFDAADRTCGDGAPTI